MLEKENISSEHIKNHKIYTSNLKNTQYLLILFEKYKAIMITFHP